MEENYNQNSEMNFPTNQYKRPPMLTVLCILTFIYSGMNCLGYLIMPLLPEMFTQAENSGLVLPDLYLQTLEDLILIPAWKFYMLALCCGAAVVGAALLIKKKIIGFHVYAASKLLNILIVSFMFTGTALQATGISIITTIVITALYFIYYFQMKKIEEFNQKSNNSNAERGF